MLHNLKVNLQEQWLQWTTPISVFYN